MNYSYIKAKSREQLKGNWLKSSGVVLVQCIIIFAIAWYINGFLGQILTIPISASVMALMFRMANNEGLDFNKLVLSKTEYIRYLVYKIIITVIQMVIGVVAIIVVTSGMMFSLIQSNREMAIENIANLDVTTLVIAFLVYILLSALFIYIDIIYSMTPFIIFRNNEDIDSISSMRYSRELLKGYKWNLFVFFLSFIGWAILSVCTLGIGFIFLAPYVEVSLSNYYLELVKVKEEYAREKGIIYRENENYYRTFVEDNTVQMSANEDNNCKASDDSDPMNVLTVEKLTTIEGYDKNDSKN